VCVGIFWRVFSAYTDVVRITGSSEFELLMNLNLSKRAVRNCQIKER
jgi:hypothetical protein